MRYRDFVQIVPFIVQILTYLSPVGYSSTQIPARWRGLYALNPMVGVIEGFRWCLLGQPLAVSAWNLVYSWALSLALLASGFWYFRKTERVFADFL